jgi:DNA-directed RNA polymerase beta subunit
VGYFIIDGAEYILIIQDKMRANYPFVNYDKLVYKVRMTCDNFYTATHVIMVKKSEIPKEKDNIYKIEIKSLSPEKSYQITNINVLQIFRIFGVKDITHIKNMIFFFTKPKWKNLLENELAVTFANLISIKNDIQSFAEIMKDTNEFKNDPKKLGDSYIERLEEELFPQYIYSEQQPRYSTNILKLYTLGMMVAKLVEMILGLRPPDDRDSWANKRLVTAGPKMYQLFNSEWKQFGRNVLGVIHKNKHSNFGQVGFTTIIKTGLTNLNIKKTFNDSFKTTWGKKYGNREPQKFTDILKRESKISPWANINRISTPGSREGKKSVAREVNMTQFGYVDPADTPEGKEGCGVVKNKAVTCWISSGGDEHTIMELLLKAQELSIFIQGIKYQYGFSTLILNGKIMGQCNGQILHTWLVSHRRQIRFKKDIMIAFDKGDNMLYVYTDNGRPTRPLLIINQETGKLIIEELNLWNADIDTLLAQGCMEYIDAFEQQFLYIAKRVSDIKRHFSDIQDLESVLNDLQTSSDEYNRSGVVNYDRLNLEKESHARTLRETENKLTSLEFDHAEDLKKINQFKTELIELNTQTYSVDLRLKFIDINYEYGRLIKKFRNRETIIEKVKKTLEKLREISYENIAFESYFSSQVEITKNALQKLRDKPKYSHCEMYPGAIFGISASVIPLANRNLATRVGFQCGMGRQALGIYHSNSMYRFDTTTKMLANPSEPIVKGQISQLIGLDQYGYGENIIIAVMTYMQWNQEDSIIVNQSSIDRGKFRSKVLKTVVIKVDETPKSNGQVDKITSKPPHLEQDNYKYRHLDNNGFARLESVLTTGDCLLGVIRTTKVGGSSVEQKSMSSFVEAVYEGWVVDTYIVTRSKGEITVKFRLRDIRFPIKGDKFASRYAQKSTISIALPQEDMPFTSDGIIPDIILNPQAFASRGTVGHIIETLIGKAAVLSGRSVVAGSFNDDIDIAGFTDIIQKHGYQRFGYERMIAGTSGKMLEAEIYIGPIYYQALKHQVKDKIQARQRGARDQLTHQPVKGRKRGGGIKFGEMERDVLISHGAANVLYNTHCVSSNAYTCVICKKCHHFFEINFLLKEKKFSCKICGDNAEIVKTTIPYSTITYAGLISATNINLALWTKAKGDQNA